MPNTVVEHREVVDGQSRNVLAVRVRHRDGQGHIAKPRLNLSPCASTRDRLITVSAHITTNVAISRREELVLYMTGSFVAECAEG